MNAVYVADLMKDDEIVETPEDTYPPGVEPLPAFAMIWEEVASYRQMGEAALKALRTKLNLRKVDTVYLSDRGGVQAQTLVWPAVVDPGVFRDRDLMVFVDDQGGGKGGRLHGRPWYSILLSWQWDNEIDKFTLQPEKDENDQPIYRWWKKIYLGLTPDGKILADHYYWDGSTWIGPWSVTPDYENYQDDVHPATGAERSLNQTAEAAIKNGFNIVINVETGEVVWPLAVPDTGFNRIARAGLIVKDSQNYKDLRIRFASSLSGQNSNFNIAVLVSEGIPDQMDDLMAIVPETYHTPDESSSRKEIAIDPAWLGANAREEPLIFWVLLVADYEEDFADTKKVGHFWDFEIVADGEKVIFEAIPWTAGAKTKIKVMGSDPVAYREMKVVR